MVSSRKASDQDLNNILDDHGDEAGKIAQKLIDSVVWSVLQEKELIGDDDGSPASYHEIMNVSDYHILYNYFKIRIEIAVDEKKNLKYLINLLYVRGRDLILDSNGVTNGRIEVFNRTMLHDVMSYHRDRFHDENSTFDCGCLLLKMLISYGADVNAKDKYGTTPYHEAAANHCENTMKMLLNTGQIDVNHKDGDGETALFYLVENIVDNKDNSIKDSTSANGVVTRLDNCLRLLLEHGLDFKTLGKNGNSAFHRMLENYYVSLPLVIAFVEMCSPDVSLKNKFGHTPIHICVKTGKKEFSRERTDILRYLCILSSKEALETEDICTKTPLVHAITNENKIFCRILFSNGASIEQQDKHGLTPLHYGCMCEDINVVKILLECDVDIYSKDCVGDVPLVYAAAHGKIDHLKLLYPLYEMTQELFNRLLMVADFNGHRDCHEMLKMIKEWDIIELEEENQKVIRKVEVELRQVDAWLRQKKDYLRKHRRSYCVSAMERFYILQALRETENQKVCSKVSELIHRISRETKQRYPHYEFTPVLAGSMAEETHIEQIDSLEFICEMNELSNVFKLEATNSEKLPGFVQLKSKHSNRQHFSTGASKNSQTSNLLQESNEQIFLSSYNVVHNFLQAVTNVLCSQEIWKDLHLSWDPERKQNGHTCTISLKWVGRNYKHKNIIVYLTPAIVLPEEPPKHSPHLHKLLQGLGVAADDIPKQMTVIAQNVKCFDVDRPDLLWKISHALCEQMIFKVIPENVLEGYRVSKFIRSEKICPRIFTLAYPKASLQGREYLPAHILKTCLFYELKTRLNVGGLELVRHADSVAWSRNIFDRLETFLEGTAIPDFFDEDINLRDDRTVDIILAICKIGKSWLHHQWDDLYGGRKPPADKKPFSDLSSPEL